MIHRVMVGSWKNGWSLDEVLCLRVKRHLAPKIPFKIVLNSYNDEHVR